MNKPAAELVNKVEQDIGWTVTFLRTIQDLHHANDTKVRTVNLLVQEEARIQPAPRELVTG